MKNLYELECPIYILTTFECSEWGTEVRIEGYYDAPGGIMHSAHFSGCSSLRWESVETDADVISSSMLDVIRWQTVEQTNQHTIVITTEAFELAVTCETYKLVEITEAREAPDLQ